MRYIGTVTAIFALVGCATTTAPKVSWVAHTKVDEFTDQKTCFVSVGSFYTKSAVYTYSNHYYPYIEVVNGKLRLGIKSGGKYPIPVGDVQLRIDSNATWTISSSETPLDYVPKGTLDSMKQYANNLPEENKELVEATYKTAMESTARIMSPFTATTGDKALKILKEMLSGQKIKYRTIGLNQAASSTGEYDLDSSLERALLQCGINL